MATARKANGKRGASLALAAIVPWGAVHSQSDPLQAADTASTTSAPHRTVTVHPRISVQETFTNNVRLVDSGAQSENITEIAPGISVNVDAANLRAVFEYSATQVLYANNTSSNQVQNTLNTTGTLEAINNWAFIDFAGSIGQQSISAFGTQSSGDTLINANQSEVSNYRISPYIRGRLSDAANYEARLSRTITQAALPTGKATDDSTDAYAKLRSPTERVGLGWSVETREQTANFSVARSTQSNRINFGLPYTFTPQVSLAAYAGSETNNFASPAKETYSTSGVGMVWSPGPLTKLDALFENRSFGDAHALTFEHRTPRTAWKLSDVKDVSVNPGVAIGVGNGNVYDLLYSQFASVQPDPLARAQLVNNYLQSQGISPNAAVTNGYLASSLALQKRQEFAVALLGIRDTITVIAMQSNARNIDTAAQGAGDLANGATVQQHGVNVNYAHRLTPEASVGLGVSQQVSANGSASATQDTRTDSLKTYFTQSLSSKGILTLELRRTMSQGILSYSETAISCSINIRL
jgi:uncharacterized protein (PEP-CTERM system associated)